MIRKFILVAIAVLMTAVASFAELRTDTKGQYPAVFAHRGCWFKGDVPENSLTAVRMAKRFGYAGVEIDVRETSDGVLVVLHDRTLKRTMRNAADYSPLSKDVAIADITFEDVRNNYVMISRHEQMREKIPTLEEVLLECKKHGLIAMMHTSTWAAYRMAHEIMGDGNWIAFTSREPSLDYARNKVGMTGPVLYAINASHPVDKVMAQLDAIGKPCGISTMDTKLLTSEYNKQFTDKGYEVQASVFRSPNDWNAYANGVTYQLTDFVVMPGQRMNLVETISGKSLTLSEGKTVSKAWPEMDYGAIVLRIKFKGTITVAVNGVTYKVTSDGKREECIGRRFCDAEPSFSLTADKKTKIKYYHVDLKEPTNL